jgi:hypothetical protein
MFKKALITESFISEDLQHSSNPSCPPRIGDEPEYKNMNVAELLSRLHNESEVELGFQNMKFRWRILPKLI